MNDFRIARYMGSYVVINKAGAIVERCHNYATAKHYQRRYNQGVLTVNSTNASFTESARQYAANVL